MNFKKLGLILMVIWAWKPVYGQEESSKISKLKLLFTPNLSIINKRSVLDAKAKLNAGVRVLFSRENTSKKFFFAYGLELNRNSHRKQNLPDNRTLIDDKGNISESNLRYFDVDVSYSYTALVGRFNYKILRKEKMNAGVAVGLNLKYFLAKKTKYFLHDGTQTLSINDTEIDNNIPVANPSANLEFWYEYHFAEAWYLLFEFNYRRDLHDSLILPQYQKVGLNFGIVKALNKAE